MARGEANGDRRRHGRDPACANLGAPSLNFTSWKVGRRTASDAVRNPTVFLFIWNVQVEAFHVLFQEFIQATVVFYAPSARPNRQLSP